MVSFSRAADWWFEHVFVLPMMLCVRSKRRLVRIMGPLVMPVWMLVVALTGIVLVLLVLGALCEDSGGES
jgi:hypothetical protein